MSAQLVRFRYHTGLPRAGKGLVRAFLAKVTGYSDAQLTRLIAQQRRTGHIRDHRLRTSRPALRDGLHDCGRSAAGRGGRGARPALGTGDEAGALWRMCHVFGDKRFERLAEISNGRIYNLRGRRAYRSARTTVRTTRAAPLPIGQRRRPRPEGRLGFVRVDTVHSGDRDGEEGAYIIDMVDEVTQYQQLAAVPPCLFAVETEDKDGRRRRKYPQELVMTPYEKLGSLPGAEAFLRPGVTFEQLDAAAHAVTDLEAAQEVQRDRKGLFRLVAKALNPAA